MTAVFYLPNHPSQVTSDPLGLSESSEEEVSVWSVLSDLLKSPDRRPQNPAGFVDILDTIAYTIHSDASKDFSCLLRFLKDVEEQKDSQFSFSFDEAVSGIFELALQLPLSFRTGSIEVLCPNKPKLFRRKSLGVVLAHQVLGTLSCPSWNDWGSVNLWQWYSDTGGQESIKKAYIQLSFSYICRLCKEKDNPKYLSEYIEFYLYEPTRLPDFDVLQYRLVPLQVCELEIEDDLPHSSLQKENESSNSLLISCHPLVGHGPSATQEERIIASYPELLPVSVLSPPLGPTASLIVKSSAHYLQPAGGFKGHGRTAVLESAHTSVGLFNEFIFMDASQRDLDNDDSEHSEDNFVQRDVKKAYSGFLGALTGAINYTNLVTVPWGAGAFGGNLLTNLFTLWVAASAAAGITGLSAEMVFLVKKGLLESFDADWRRNFQEYQDELSVGRAWRRWRGEIPTSQAQGN